MIHEATEEDMRSSDLAKRATYSLVDFAKSIARYDNGEALVAQAVIEAQGLRCEPFWNTPDDLEGREYQSYIASHPGFSLQLRQDVVARLVRAQSLLPTGWKLVLKAGYRPYEVQVGLLDALIAEVSGEHAQWSRAEILAHARTYVSDPKVVCPPHVTGGAVDLDVLDGSGMPVDMGCPPNTDSEIAFLFSDKISEDAQQNRRKLFDAMVAAGFAPLAAEWWHYQYGETLWAAFYGHASTKYDLIKL